MSRVVDRVRESASPRARRRLAQHRVRVRRLTSSQRPLPSFMIVGTQRGGTSSLYKQLERHPDLAASVRKETEFFTRHFGEGEGWYRAHFPFARGRLAYEATPDYLFYPPTPTRVASSLPDERFIVLLRDPVDRAYSHYRHMVRLGFEDLSFEQALLHESERIEADLRALTRDPMHYPRALLRFSYAARGRYAEQLEQWFGAFDRSRFLIVQSEDYFARPLDAYMAVVRFLGIRTWRPNVFGNHSYATPPPAPPSVSPDAVALLRDALAPDVQRLEELLGRSMGWELGRSSEGVADA